MMYRLPKKRNRGFTATVAVILLSMASLAFSYAITEAAASYADSVNRHELRIQARQNAASCADTVRLMRERDVFLSGTVTVREFGCTANLVTGHIQTNLEGVSFEMDEAI